MRPNCQNVELYELCSTNPRGPFFAPHIRGTYTSPMYRDKAESYNLVLSYSRRGNCYDNACMENFYGHLKSETIYQLPITQRYCLRREELKNIIDNYIIWYNNERIQAKLNYLSPVEFCLKNYHQTVAI